MDLYVLMNLEVHAQTQCIVFYDRWTCYGSDYIKGTISQAVVRNYCTT